MLCRAGAAAGSPCTEAAPCPPSLTVKGAEGKRGKKPKPHPGCAGRNRVLPPLPRSRLGMLAARCHQKTRDGGASAPPRIATTSPRRRAGVSASVTSSPFPGGDPLLGARSRRQTSRKELGSSAGLARDPPAPAGAQGGVCRAGAAPCPASAPPLPLGKGRSGRPPRRSRSGGPASLFPAGAGWRRALALTVRERRPFRAGRGPCPHPALPQGLGGTELS